jgi:class 3 adenylate cyclase/ligand-binding sensor domain-containing protein
MLQIKKICYLSILFTGILAIKICVSQPQKLIFRHLEDKFPHIEAPAEPIYEDSHGYIWWAGNTHLHKYNGYDVTSYSFKSICGIEDVNATHTIVRFLEDRQGKFWISANHLLFLYDRLTETFTRITLELENTSSLPSILSMYEDNKHRIWIGTYFDVLLHFKSDMIPSPGISLKGSVPEVIVPKENIKIFHMDTILNYERKNRPYLHPVHNSIIQDKYGDIWIRTADCLSRYIDNDNQSNGIFVNYYYDKKETLLRYFPPANGLFLDKDSTVWIYFYGRFFSFEQSPIATSFTPINVKEEGIVSPRSSRWWKTYIYADSMNPANRERLHSERKINEYIFDHPSHFWAMHQDEFWISSENTIYLYGKIKDQNYTIFKNIQRFDLPENDPYGIRNKLQFLLINHEGILWCGDAPDGIINADLNYLQKFTKYRNIPSDPTSLPVPDNNINSMVKDHTGNFWLSSGNDIYLTDDKFQLIRKITIPNNTTKILVDPNQNIWLMGNRLYILNMASFYSGSPLNSCLYSLTNKNIPFKGEWYNDMIIDRKGLMWITVFNDLYYVDLNIYSGKDFSLMKSILFDEFKPLQEHDKDSIMFKTFIPGPISDNIWIQYVYEDNNNENKWGFYNINIHSGEMIQFIMDSARINPGGWIEMHIDDSSNLYLSNKISFYKISFKANNNGEYVVGKINSFDEEDGSSLSPTGMVFDSHKNLWFCDNLERGIYCMNTIKGNIMKFTGSEIIDTPIRKVTSYKDADDRIYFQSTDGISVFHPDSIKDHIFIPPVHITGININHEPFLDQLDSGQIAEYRNSNTLILPYSKNTVSFVFSALSFANPELNRYAYKLEGLDKDWIYVNSDNRQAAYTELSSGNYTFLVKGSNKDNLWNDKGTSIFLTILPPWWFTWWAKIIYVLAFIGTIWGFIYLRIRKHKLKLREMQMINDAFSKFVPYEFLHAIGREYIMDVQLGDKTYREVTVLFLDIRDYTTLSESMNPDDNFAFIQKFVGLIGPVIVDNQGFINQYLGDGIMAIFPERADDALSAAIDIQKKLINYNQNRSETGKKEIYIGAGLHTGPLIMGIIGDEKRRDPATISDSVNTASRIEGMTKFYGANIMISENSYNVLKNPDEYHLRYLGKVIVKGKNQPTGVYECYDGDAKEIRDKKHKSMKEFKEALDLFYNKDFHEASEVFQQISKNNQDDKTSAFFYNKAVNYALKGVPKDWTGVEKMEMK